jgi:hypothetical protein
LSLVLSLKSLPIRSEHSFKFTVLKLELVRVPIQFFFFWKKILQNFLINLCVFWIWILLSAKIEQKKRIFLSLLLLGF